MLRLIRAGLLGLVSVLLAVSAGVQASGQQLHYAGNLASVLVSLAGGCPAGSRAGFVAGTGSRVVIINAPRADRPPYWQRTGDMWVVGAITALLGAVAGLVLGLLV